MTELYFLRHGQRIDDALELDPSAKPLYNDYKPYDPSLSEFAETQINDCCEDIVSVTQSFSLNDIKVKAKKTIFIHFSPYLRCCQTADLLITYLKPKIEEKFPNFTLKFQLLGDFALSEWIHDKMKNKPPFMDSNDAYQMFTPNLKLLKNRSACSNFRPCITLGHYNGYDLSYKDYQDNCKEYFKKLLATYDKPVYINNQDIIIVVSHGYMINNILSYFVNHPIFDEIPEAKINYARLSPENDDGDGTTTKYNWRLERDALNMFNFNHIDTSLNLNSDIVYYKTNFIKRDDFNQEKSVITQNKEDKPRASFKIPHTSQSYQIESNKSGSNNVNIRNPNILNNPICPAAKNWTPQKINTFLIKREFKEKVMSSDVFKSNYNIINHPKRPVTPEVSPFAEPAKNNSVIDLSKLSSNDDYKPMKLKYSTTGDISLHQLNQKVNSQVNLAQFQRSNSSSNNSSTTDFPRFFTGIKRTTSINNHNIRSNLLPKLLNNSSSNESLYKDIDSVLDNHDFNIIKEARNASDNSYTHVPSVSSPVHSMLNRSKSARYKNEQAMDSSKSLLALSQKQPPAINDEQEKFTLSFKTEDDDNDKHKPNTSPKPHRHRSRGNSIKFIPSVLKDDHHNTYSNGLYKTESTPVDNKPSLRPPLVTTKSKSMFYNLDLDTDSNTSLSSDEENNIESNDQTYNWFGQNRI